MQRTILLLSTLLVAFIASEVTVVNASPLPNLPQLTSLVRRDDVPVSEPANTGLTPDNNGQADTKPLPTGTPANPATTTTTTPPPTPSQVNTVGSSGANGQSVTNKDGSTGSGSGSAFSQTASNKPISSSSVARSSSSGNGSTGEGGASTTG
ncbi:hypothetical protein BDF22DRAFT_739525 [Syncephalis plumigaleata]|nr:hypothetical protein BDF22DRAFT_739525 [Syncephalis plumigaleata]